MENQEDGHTDLEGDNSGRVEVKPKSKGDYSRIPPPSRNKNRVETLPPRDLLINEGVSPKGSPPPRTLPVTPREPSKENIEKMQPLHQGRPDPGSTRF